MWRTFLAGTFFLVMIVAGKHTSLAQASKQLEEKSKGMEQGQQKSWQQVDEINKETDKTKSRYQQSQQQGAHPSQKPVSTLKKTRIGTAGAYKKPALLKKGPKKK